MAITERSNVNTSGQLLQTRLDRTALKNFEPNLRFYDMGKKSKWKQGYNTLAWTKVNRMLSTPASAVLTEGVTPSDSDIRVTTIEISAVQYGKYATLTDLLEDVSPIPLMKEGLEVIGADMARIIDTVIQANLETNGTNVLYAGTATSRATIGAGDVMTPQLMAKANAFLSTKAVPTMGDAYVAIMHPNVIYDLQTGSTAGSFIDLKKYTQANATQILKGEIGMLYGVRAVKSAWIQYFTSTVRVYPTYVLGQGAYGVANLQGLKTYITPGTASDSDPLLQRRKIGMKVAFNSIILQQDALLRLETASALDYEFGV